MKGTLVPDGKADPHYRVNMDLVPVSWDAEPWQLIRHRNPSWANSAWLGVVTNFLNLPKRVFVELVSPLLCLDLKVVLLSLVFIPVTTIAFMLAGLSGQLHCLPLALHVIDRSRLCTDQEAAEDKSAGETAFLKPAWPLQ